jgi:hypothetical protein
MFGDWFVLMRCERDEGMEGIKLWILKLMS